jgi:hypothetical protein
MDQLPGARHGVDAPIDCQAIWEARTGPAIGLTKSL